MNKYVSKEDWQQWASNPVTRAYIEHIQGVIDTLIERMINKDPSYNREGLDEYAMHCLALRSIIEGLTNAIDFKEIEEDIVIQPNIEE